MVLRCTKKLLDTYKVNSAVEITADDFYSWHADLFYIDRRKCLIFMNDVTKFCITLYDMSKAEFEKEAIGLWAESLIRVGAKFSISEIHIEKYIKHCLSDPQGISFTKTNNRSVITHMNRQKDRAMRIVYDYLKDGILHTIEINEKLNNVPIMSMDWGYPYEAFAKKLKEEFGGKVHRMKLDPEPFDLIASGRKTYEIRLFDEKRRSLRICDKIIFMNTQDGQELQTVIYSLKCFANFKELCREYCFRVFGCNDGCTEDEFIATMRKYYSEKEETRYGVLAIRLGVL